METNKTYNVIPKLQMPELIRTFMIEEDKHLSNLKEVIRAHNTAYYSTVRNTLIRHKTMSQSFSMFKYCAMIAPILGLLLGHIYPYHYWKYPKWHYLVIYP